MDIATFHVGQIKAGQFNQFAGNESLSSVAYDQRIDYYDLAGLDVTANEFAAFVAAYWSTDNHEVTIDDARAAIADGWPKGVYVVNLD
jgi:hypothetical protein